VPSIAAFGVFVVARAAWALEADTTPEAVTMAVVALVARWPISALRPPSASQR
jgi:hypothetical protein